MPLDRRVVWASKVSFALVTTLALTLLLLAMAAISSDQSKPQGPLSVWKCSALECSYTSARVGAFLVSDIEHGIDCSSDRNLLHRSEFKLSHVPA